MMQDIRAGLAPAVNPKSAREATEDIRWCVGSKAGIVESAGWLICVCIVSQRIFNKQRL
jgi:hypothetical protein